MPLYNTADPLNIRPTILPQSPGDIEEARVKRLLDLQQLQNLQNQTPLELRRQALERAGLDETSRFHTNTLGVEQRGQDVQQRGQDLQSSIAGLSDTTQRRGQDIEAQSRQDTLTAQKEEAKQQHIERILDVAGRNPSASLQTLADLAGALGAPEIKKGLEAGHAHEVDTKATKIAAQLHTFKDAGETAGYLQTANQAKADPEVYKRALELDPTLNDLKSTGPDHVPTPPSPTPGYNPNLNLARAPLAVANAGIGLYNNLFLPVSNLTRSLVSASPAKRQKYAGSYSDLFSTAQ